MKAKFGSKVLLAAALCASTTVSAEVVRHPTNAGVALEQVQFYNPINYQGGNFQEVTTMTRPTGWFFQSATIDERFDIVFGLGATAFSLAKSGPTGSGYENEMYPAVAMVQASGSYTWGDLNAPALKASFGAMPYKYNPDAKDLGEYLFRATPYPGTVLNSPFNLVGGAKADVLGGILSMNLAGGKWKNDFLLTSMNWTTPLYDLSAAFVTRYKINPVFEVGAGVNFYRVIPMTSKGTTNEGSSNAYFTYQGEKLSSLSDYYNRQNTAEDSARAKVADSVSNALLGLGAMPTGVSGLDYYSFQGTMLMARFSMDLKPVLGHDLKLYGEWAWLGIKNYPVYFEDPLERMPMMLGVHIPTFGLLDAFGVEMQYWKTPYFNSLVGANYTTNSPIPDLNATTYQNMDLDDLEPVTHDDFRWSVSGTKAFGKVFSVTAKAARDHAQLMQLMGAGFPGKSYGDVAGGKDSWYYVFRLQMAI